MSGRWAAAVAAFAALAALAVGVVLGTHVAGGSDSSCYLNTARLLSRGAVGIEQPLVRIGAWPYAPAVLAPTGFTPSPADPSLLVPICSPGLSLVMALFRLCRASEFLVVPLLGALGVWLTFAIGRAIDRPMTGAAAALLVLCSPTFLYQVVQPMSDVPAMAWWLLALAFVIEREDGSNRPGMAGAAVSMALLTRPNLSPLAIPLAVYLFRWGRGSGGVRVSRFAAGLVPGVVLLALLQRAMYGSPLATGYGSVGNMMSMAHIGPNLRRYAEWLLTVHTPILVLAAAAPAVLRRQRHAWLCLAMAGITVASYLPYLVFEDWWYTRFLLPAIPLLIVLTVATVTAMTDRVMSTARLPLTAACVAAVMALWTRSARAGHAFDLGEMEQHFYRAGTAVAEHLPAPSLVVTVKDSGSVQYHAGLPTLSWDIIDPASLDDALALVSRNGYAPYLLLETEEEPAFRDRFRGASVIAALDWPPFVQVGRRIRIYDPSARAGFLRDGRVETLTVPDAPVPSRDWRRWFRSAGARQGSSRTSGPEVPRP